MLDFPSSPVIDQTYQGPSGQLWRWTGNMWSAVRRPVLGVTDGSNAAPGEVGEYLDSGIINTALPPGAFQRTTVSIALPAGDWDVSGWVSVLTQSSGAGLGAAIGQTNLNPQTGDFFYVFAPATTNFSTWVGNQRMNTSASTMIYLWMYASQNLIVALGRLEARRMR